MHVDQVGSEVARSRRYHNFEAGASGRTRQSGLQSTFTLFRDAMRDENHSFMAILFALPLRALPLQTFAPEPSRWLDGASSPATKQILMADQRGETDVGCF